MYLERFQSNRLRVILWLLCASAMMGAGTARAQYTGDYQTNIISGVTSNWGGDYVIGSNSTHDALFIQSGGVLSNGAGSVGVLASGGTGSDNIATVSGNGSTWNNSGDLNIGVAGRRNQLIIIDGGAVYDNTGRVGVPAPTSISDNSALVSGSGSVWSNRNDLVVGGVVGCSLTIANGGAVYNNNAAISGDQGILVLVTDTGSAWSVKGGLTISGGPLGGMIVSNGGFVHSESAIISQQGTSVLVTGPGSVWTIDNNLKLQGIGNSLTAADQGVVSADSVQTGDSTITVSGGALFVTNGTATAVLKGNLSASGINVTLNSGTLAADELVDVNMMFNGGVLRTKATTISSGSAFAVGDGTHGSTFILDSGGSGFHSFANGLTVSSNATLKGNGIIVGSTVVNGGGVLAPGASPGSITFSNSLTLAPNSTFAVEFNGTADGQYDQIVTLDTVSVSNSVLSLSLGYTPSAGDTFTIISNLGPSAVFGAFVDPQGDVLLDNATFVVDETTFEISYAGNTDGQDVILTAVIPEPATWLLTVLGIVPLLGGRRLRRYATLLRMAASSPHTERCPTRLVS